MWNGGLTELQVMKGYWAAIGAMLLPIVGETILFDFPQKAPNVGISFVCLIFRASGDQF